MPDSHSSPALNLKQGCVVLVGAGPGAADLITQRGEKWLKRADVVLYDYLANPALLSRVTPGTELVCLGRHGAERVWTQTQINQRIVAEALAGKCVVRLKGGDPTIFGCLAQELASVIEAGLPFEIVPGVTAATAAAAGAGIAITHRDLASAIGLVTGREDQDKTESALDYAALARFPGTLVFYMGTTTVGAWSQGLISAGKPADTPVAIVRRASLPDQSVRASTLGEVAELVRATPPLRPPVVFLVGPIASTEQWLVGSRVSDGRGQSVLVTRPAEQGKGLVQALEASGFQAARWPALEVAEPESWNDVDQILASENNFDWIAFTSANGVDGLLGRLFATGRDSRWLGRSRLAAVGRGTAQRLHEYCLRPDLVPDSFDAHSLAELLASQNPRPQRVLFAAAEQSRPTLPSELRGEGIEVQSLTVYRTLEPTAIDPWTIERMEAGQWNWTTVTSPRIAESLHKVFGERLRKTKLASLSPLTSARLIELGHEVAAEARTASDEGLCQAILEQC